MVKGPIPPQLPYLADALVEVVRADVAAASELFVDATVTVFPAIEAKWRNCDRISATSRGSRRPSAQIRDITPNTGTEPINPKAAFAQVFAASPA